MNSFIYDIPVKVYFGRDQLSHLGTELRKFDAECCLRMVVDQSNVMAFTIGW